MDEAIGAIPFSLAEHDLYGMRPTSQVNAETASQSLPQRRRTDAITPSINVASAPLLCV